MARPAQNQGLMPSLLDRLIDPDSAGTEWQRGYGPAQMLEAVRRDLEDLFNTHRSALDFPSALTETSASVVAFGMPDLAAIYSEAGGSRKDIPRLVAEIVARFEPRLRDVRVVMVDTEARGERRVRFQIEAGLNVDPSPEVAFETTLELATGHASIRADEA